MTNAGYHESVIKKAITQIDVIKVTNIDDFGRVRRGYYELLKTEPAVEPTPVESKQSTR